MRASTSSIVSFIQVLIATAFSRNSSSIASLLSATVLAGGGVGGGGGEESAAVKTGENWTGSDWCGAIWRGTIIFVFGFSCNTFLVPVSCWVSWVIKFGLWRPSELIVDLFIWFLLIVIGLVIGILNFHSYWFSVWDFYEIYLFAKVFIIVCLA